MAASGIGVKARGGRAGRWAPALVWVLIACYAALFSWLSVLRHQTFGSAAMDLGYTTQVVWNTLHGRPLQFSTYENATIDLPLEQFRRTDTLLAYHVELLLIPIALLYALYASPVTLLVLQAAVVALGAWPTFLLARDRLRSTWAAVAFAVAYLLAPALQGALLSDFHAVALTSTLLLFAFYFAQARRFRAFGLYALVAMMTKEDVPLLVAAMGVYIWLVLRERRAGLYTIAAGLGWFLVCTQLILPYFSGLPSSPFLRRLAIFGPTLRQSVANWLRDPLLVVRWLARPEVTSYLSGLLASSGFLAVFAPLVVGMAAPVVAVNVFSNWSWTYSEGVHYSAAVVPFVMAGGICGMANASHWLARRTGWPLERWVLCLSTFLLGVAGFHHYEVGVSPFARTFFPPAVTAHIRLGHTLLARIPPDAAVSAQSNLYPHVAQRLKAYFFPAVNDAEYVFLDVTSPSYPLNVEGMYLAVRRLLRSGQFEVLVAQDGYLLLRRRPAAAAEPPLPADFYTFVQAAAPGIRFPLAVRFGDALELVGYDYSILNMVQAHELPASVTTCWRALRPLELDYRFALFFTRADGAIIYSYSDETSGALWYPPYEWGVGEVACLQTPLLGVGRLRDVLLAVSPPGADPWRAAERLPVQPAQRQDAEVLDSGTLLRLFRFP